VEFPFESTYGYFELNLIDLTGDYVQELVLIAGRGRGTSVRSELLRVFAVHGRQLKQLMELPVSGYFGSRCRWWYRRDYVFEYRRDRPALERGLQLTLEHDPTDSCEPFFLSVPSLIPKADVLEYGYDSASDQMTPLSIPAGDRPKRWVKRRASRSKD